MHVSQLRALQGQIANLSTLALCGMDHFNKTLHAALPRRDDQIASLRFVDVGARNATQTRGVLFQLLSDPKTLSRLILPENAAPAPALHVDLPFDGTQPMLVDLLYVAGTRQKRTGVANYFFSGALATYEDTHYGYTLIQSGKRDRLQVDQLAEALRILNLPVQDLPYPPGRKLSILDIFKRMDIRYVGDLVRYDAERLQENLGAMEWITVRSILKGLHFEPGKSIPQWRRPSTE